jgi:hypothetical protein
MRMIVLRRVMLFWMLCVPALGATTAAAQSEGGGTINIGPQPCAEIAQLSEAPGVAYTPGVDARGNEVAPADLTGSSDPAQSKTLTQLPVKITTALLRKYGFPASENPFQGRAGVGYVVVRDGKAYLDGRELSPPATALLADACRQKR